jgi:ubiquinone/menaquinone biosynthesis C-methylase UbiE
MGFMWRTLAVWLTKADYQGDPAHRVKGVSLLDKNKDNLLFDSIAPIYGLFYHRQKKRFSKVIESVQKELDLTSYKSVLDVGCGTGALCSVLKGKGLSVTGIDPAIKMLDIARNQPENKGILFLKASILEHLSFEDKSFDITIASYVAHGMQKGDRKTLYIQMGRLAKHKVIIYDYNQNRGLLVSLAEWLEHGDYFRFIKVAREEMEQCANDMKQCFEGVKAIDVGARAAWYICTPK